jgi:serine/threonine protein kinase/tetratricopeptide (TPR) repeat protein
MSTDTPEAETESRDLRSIEEASLQRIGPYKILEALGEGGFGIVYLAEQTKPVHRRVALKVIKPGMDSKAVLARFEAEEQALALMDHPNVAKVFSAGTTEQGRPYFAMEHVSGVPITEHCDRQKLSIEERLDLFMKTCDAVQHAHQKSVIHRDIKPSNILVAFKDGQPIPKVIDFGVAKAISQPLTERTLFTEQGQLIGTPAYMSPEQAEMTAQDIDTRTDIYSLGVLLYELLTGALPFDPASLRQAAFDEIRRIIREVEPPKPSTKLSSMITAGGDDSTSAARNRRADPRTLNRHLRGDLDWITMKALEKDRARRYASASDFAADIRRHLTHEPVVAGPPTAAYRVKKFVRRNRGLVTGIAAVFSVLVTGMIVSTILYAQADVARRDAVESQAAAEQARGSEEVQRQRAEVERDRAIAAEKLAEQRLAEVVEARDQAKKEAEKSASVIDFLRQMFSSIYPWMSQSKRHDVTVREVLDEAATRVETELGSQPEVEAAIRYTIGMTYSGLGLNSEAEPHLRRALATFRETHGNEHVVVADALLMLGGTLAGKGEYVEAERLLREALSIYRDREEGEEASWRLALVIGALANVAAAFGREDEAESLYIEAMVISRKVFGDKSRPVAWNLIGLAGVVGDQDRNDEAERLFREALEIYRNTLGEEHSSVASCMSGLGNQLTEQGKYEEAERLLREGLLMSRKLLGNEHPVVAGALHHLAWNLANQGKNNEAERVFHELIPLKRKISGEVSSSLAQALHAFAVLRESQEQYGEAAELCRQALTMKRQVLGHEAPSTVECMSDLGRILGEHRRYDEAERLAREALRLNRRFSEDGIFPKDDRRLLESLDNLASVLYGKGADGEAEQLYREALAICRAARGDEHPAVAMRLLSLAYFLNDKGDTAASVPLLRDALAVLRNAYGTEHSLVGATLNNLGVALRDEGELSESEEMLRQAVKTFQTTRGDDSWEAANPRSHLGECLTKMSRYDEAERELLEAHRVLSAALGEEHKRTIKAVERLVALYEAWDAAEPGKGYAEKAVEWRAMLPPKPSSPEAPADDATPNEGND